MISHVIKCGFCGEVNGKNLYTLSCSNGIKFFLNQCGTCSAYFLSPRVPVDESYTEDYYGGESSKFLWPFEAIFQYFTQKRARRIQKLIKPPARVLDIGCGDGSFLGNMIQHGYEGYGTELPGKAAKKAAQLKGLQLLTGELELNSYPKQYFDLISLWHVFEHLSHPQEMLEKIVYFIKPGGYVALSLPNIESLQSCIFGGKWFHLDPPRHLFFLNRRRIMHELSLRGFQLIYERHFSFEYNVFGIQQSLLNTITTKRDVLYESLKGKHDSNDSVSILVQKAFCVVTVPFFTLLALAESSLLRGGTMEFLFQKKVY